MRTNIASRFALAAVVGVGVLTAAQPAAAAPGTTPPGWQRCVNPYENFSVGHPASWHTAQIRPQEVCRQFHPTPFTIPPESEYPLTALNVRRVPVPPSRTDTLYERVLRWERTTVAGRPAIRFETVSTGEGLYLAGTKQYGYVMRRGPGLISVHTTAEPGETRYPAWKRIVNKAARTLTTAPS